MMVRRDSKIPPNDRDDAPRPKPDHGNRNSVHREKPRDASGLQDPPEDEEDDPHDTGHEEQRTSDEVDGIGRNVTMGAHVTTQGDPKNKCYCEGDDEAVILVLPIGVHREDRMIVRVSPRSCRTSMPFVTIRTYSVFAWT